MAGPVVKDVTAVQVRLRDLRNTFTPTLDVYGDYIPAPGDATARNTSRSQPQEILAYLGPSL